MSAPVDEEARFREMIAQEEDLRANLLGGCHVIFREDWCDPAFPNMTEWARAGVQGGIRDLSVPPAAVIYPESSQDILQDTMDRVAENGGGWILIHPGRYEITRTLKMRSGVVLRGVHADAVLFHIDMDGYFQGFRKDDRPDLPAGILFDGVEQAGLSDITLLYRENLARVPSVRKGDRQFLDAKSFPEPEYVISIQMESSRNCWVQFCRVLDSGTTPIGLHRCRHITLRQNEIHGARHQGGGQAYLAVVRSSHCLLEGLVIKDIRHLSIMNSDAKCPCSHNVVLNCDLEVDINFHDGDSGHNLIQDCRIVIPSWHWWGPFAHGVKGKHLPPGPDNRVFRCHAERRQMATLTRSRVAEKRDRVYRIRDSYHFEEAFLLDDKKAPLHGTLYPVAPATVQ